MVVTQPVTPEVMETFPTLMVQMGDFNWTQAAMRVACQYAREMNAKIALVKLIPIIDFHPLNANTYVFDVFEQAQVDALIDIAKVQGVRCHPYVMAYDDLETGITAAADALGADSVLALVHGREARHLGRKLQAHHHHLYAVDEPALTIGWKPEAHYVNLD